jgi:hypothetical protein
MDVRRTTWSYRPPRPSPAFQRLALHRPPRTCEVAAAPPGGRRRASRRSNSVRTTSSVGGWSRLGASSRLQIGRWGRRQCHMPEHFWVTGRAINPLNASVATFCAAGVIGMHQTPPGMVRGVSGVSRGRFFTISTGSHSEYGRWCSCSIPQTHHPDQPADHTAFQTHWARLVSNMGHRSPHLRALGAHVHHF